MTTKHTPGPWKLEHLQVVAPSPRYPTSNLLVAQVYETSMMVDEPDHANADAALISAAPELLEALKETQEALWIVVKLVGIEHVAELDIAERADLMASAAIAKAEAKA